MYDSPFEKDESYIHLFHEWFTFCSMISPFHVWFTSSCMIHHFHVWYTLWCMIHLFMHDSPFSWNERHHLKVMKVIHLFMYDSPFHVSFTFWWSHEKVNHMKILPEWFTFCMNDSPFHVNDSPFHVGDSPFQNVWWITWKRFHASDSHIPEWFTFSYNDSPFLVGFTVSCMIYLSMYDSPINLWFTFSCID